MSSPSRLESLDAWRDPGREVRIAVESWCIRERIRDQYIERPHSLRVVWAYLRHVGPVTVWRKIRSRLSEARRNCKVAAVGVGRILEAPAGCSMSPGQWVVFFAPNHSPGRLRLCLDVRLVVPFRERRERCDDRARSLPQALLPYVGWSPYSGLGLDADAVARGLSAMERCCQRIPVDAAGHASAGASGAVSQDRLEARARSNSKPSAVLFGFGNYAKTQIVPVIRRHLSLTCVHEIDPDQLASAASTGATLDACPKPRAAEGYDVWFIAGFHHTHAPLAVHALRQGAYAVVEKPIATTWTQLRALTELMEKGTGRGLFGCFHKRYSRLTEWARQDLGAVGGEPVDMYCIVYEIPLPRLHWYNWPNSGSRLVSNGCHWLDYFLYMNDFTDVVAFDLWPLSRSDMAVRVRLSNDANLVMSLTDRGSQRLGVRDVIELRASNVTVRMIDGVQYQSESTLRVLRRKRVNPVEAYQRMYEAICAKVVAGQQGDVLASLRSTALMLNLEETLPDRKGLLGVRGETDEGCVGL